MPTSKHVRSMSFILAVYIILFSFLSIGFVSVYANHDCQDHLRHEVGQTGHKHGSDQDCEICLHIESLLSLGKEMISSGTGSDAPMFLIASSLEARLSGLENIVYPTPVTLKVKMTN